MKKLLLLVFLTSFGVTLTSCDKDDDGCYHFDEPSVAPAAEEPSNNDNLGE